MEDFGYVLRYEDGTNYAPDGKSGLIGATVFRTEIAASLIVDESDQKSIVMKVKLEIVE